MRAIRCRPRRSQHTSGGCCAKLHVSASLPLAMYAALRLLLAVTIASNEQFVHSRVYFPQGCGGKVWNCLLDGLISRKSKIFDVSTHWSMQTVGFGGIVHLPHSGCDCAQECSLRSVCLTCASNPTKRMATDCTRLRWCCLWRGFDEKWTERDSNSSLDNLQACGQE